MWTIAAGGHGGSPVRLLVPHRADSYRVWRRRAGLDGPVGDRRLPRAEFAVVPVSMGRGYVLPSRIGQGHRRRGGGFAPWGRPTPVIRSACSGSSRPSSSSPWLPSNSSPSTTETRWSSRLGSRAIIDQELQQCLIKKRATRNRATTSSCTPPWILKPSNGRE